MVNELLCINLILTVVEDSGKLIVKNIHDFYHCVWKITKNVSFWNKAIQTIFKVKILEFWHQNYQHETFCGDFQTLWLLLLLLLHFLKLQPSQSSSHIIRYSLKFIAFVIIVIKLECSCWAFEQAHYPIGPSKIITTILIGPAPQQLSYKKKSYSHCV